MKIIKLLWTIFVGCVSGLIATFMAAIGSRTGCSVLIFLGCFSLLFAVGTLPCWIGKLGKSDTESVVKNTKKLKQIAWWLSLCTAIYIMWPITSFLHLLLIFVPLGLVYEFIYIAGLLIIILNDRSAKNKK